MQNGQSYTASSSERCPNSKPFAYITAFTSYEMVLFFFVFGLLCYSKKLKSLHLALLCSAPPPHCIWKFLENFTQVVVYCAMSWGMINIGHWPFRK